MTLQELIDALIEAKETMYDDTQVVIRVNGDVWKIAELVVGRSYPDNNPWLMVQAKDE